MPERSDRKRRRARYLAGLRAKRGTRSGRATARQEGCLLVHNPPTDTQQGRGRNATRKASRSSSECAGFSPRSEDVSEEPLEGEARRYSALMFERVVDYLFWAVLLVSVALLAR